MKARFLLAAAAFACAVFTAEAFDSFKDAFQAARKARNEKNYDEALKICTEAKSLASKSWEKYTIADIEASAYWGKNDLKSALAKLDELIDMEGTSADQKVFAMVKKANYLKWKSRRDEAEAVYKKAMEIDVKGHPRQDLLNAYADLLRFQKKFDDAMELYKQAAAIEKGHPAAQQVAKLGIATTSADMKDYDKAMQLYNEIIENPKAQNWIKASAYRGIAEKIYLPRKKYAECAEFMKKVEADENIPKNQKGWIGTVGIRMNVDQIKALLKEKKYDEAMEKAKETKNIQTQDSWSKYQRDAIASEVEIHRANDLKNQKNFDEAIGVYKKVAEMEGTPEYRKQGAILGIAACLIQQKKLDEAKEQIDKAMAFPKQEPNMKASAANVLADYYLTKKQFDDAIAALENLPLSSKQLDPGWKASVYTKLASICFYRKKDLAKADEYIKKAKDVPNAKWGRNKKLEEQIKAALEKQNQ